jgi:hypothetical protein
VSLTQLNDRTTALEKLTRTPDHANVPDPKKISAMAAQLVELTDAIGSSKHLCHDKKKILTDLKGGLLNRKFSLSREGPFAGSEIVYRTIVEAKSKETEAFLRAKENPHFARVIKIRKLPPEQAESQKRMRATIDVSQSPTYLFCAQMLRTALDELDGVMKSVRDVINGTSQGKSSSK